MLILTFQVSFEAHEIEIRCSLNQTLMTMLTTMIERSHTEMRPWKKKCWSKINVIVRWWKTEIKSLWTTSSHTQPRTIQSNVTINFNYFLHWETRSDLMHELKIALNFFEAASITFDHSNVPFRTLIVWNADENDKFPHHETNIGIANELLLWLLRRAWICVDWFGVHLLCLTSEICAILF